MPSIIETDLVEPNNNCCDQQHDSIYDNGSILINPSGEEIVKLMGKITSGKCIINSKKGSASCIINGRAYSIFADYLIFIRAAQEIQEIKLSDDFEGIVAWCNDSLLNQVYPYYWKIVPSQNIPDVMTTVLSASDSKVLSWHMLILSMIINDGSNNTISISEENALLINSLSEKILSIFKKYYCCKTSSCKRDTLIEQYFDLIHKYGDSERSLSFYADKLGVKAKRLSAIIVRATGAENKYWTAQKTMNRAKEMLVNSEEQIRDIATALNFNNSAEFCRYFHNHADESPLKYRLTRRK